MLRQTKAKKLHLWLAAALHTSMMAFFQIFCACTASWSSPHVDLIHTDKSRAEQRGSEWDVKRRLLSPQWMEIESRRETPKWQRDKSTCC